MSSVLYNMLYDILYNCFENKCITKHNLLSVLHTMFVIEGYDLLLCSLPVRGLKLDNFHVLHPTVLAVSGVILGLPAFFILVGGIGYSSALVSSRHLLRKTQSSNTFRAQCLGVEVFAIQDVDLFGDPRIGRLEVK